MNHSYMVVCKYKKKTSIVFLFELSSEILIVHSNRQLKLSTMMLGTIVRHIAEIKLNSHLIVLYIVNNSTIVRQRTTLIDSHRRRLVDNNQQSSCIDHRLSTEWTSTNVLSFVITSYQIEKTTTA